jgi:hypothetical protein
MFKLIITLGFVISIQVAKADTHIRFWRGFKQDTSTSAEFKYNVAEHLVPATVTVGKDKGLVSYMPVFLTNDQAKPEFVPDEIAIIQYEDEATYKNLAATPEFSAYGKMHYAEGFFTKKNKAGFGSGSLASQTLTEATQFDLDKASAVNYGEVHQAWKNNHVQMKLVLLKDSTKEKSDCLQTVIMTLKDAVRNNTLKGFILAYDPNYILVFTKASVTTELNLQSLSPSCLSQRLIELKNQKTFDNQTEGLNVSF